MIKTVDQALHEADIVRNHLPHVNVPTDTERALIILADEVKRLEDKIQALYDDLAGEDL